MAKSKTKIEWVTQAELARILDVDRSRVSYLLHKDRRLRPAARKVGKRFMLDKAKALAIIEATRAPQQIAGGDSTSSYIDARAMREKYRALGAKLEYEQKREELMSKADVVREATVAGILIKEKLSAIPGRLGALAAAESDPFKCEQMLKLEINQVLEDLSVTLSKAELKGGKNAG